MSYSRTIEVDVIRGHIKVVGSEILPDHAHRFLTITSETLSSNHDREGLRRLLARPKLSMTAQQVHAVLDEDYWDQ